MDRSLLKREGFYAWVTLAGAGMVFFVGAGITTYAFGLFAPHIIREFGWSRGLVYVALSIGPAISALSSPIIGWFVGKYGARRAVVSGSLLCGLGFVLLSFHSRIWQFYAAYGLFIGMGVSLSSLIPCSTLVNDWFERKGLWQWVFFCQERASGRCSCFHLFRH